jgi:hypothetical protein
MTPDIFDDMAALDRAIQARRGQRPGQAHFNALYELRPDLADEIRGTDLDPFYNDTRIPEFLCWVVAHWRGAA